jgi:antirestriction protein ArdC
MKRDIYQEITTAILEALQAGVRPWKQCYTTSLPLRTTGEHYKGINCLRLMLEAERQGYASPHWMTWQQATERGGYVRKGEKSTLVCFFTTFEKEAPDTEEGTVRIPVARAYHVFNLEQLEGVGQDTLGEKPTIITETSRFFAALPGNIGETQQVPAYIPSKDLIVMPAMQRFTSVEAYWEPLKTRRIAAVRTDCPAFC